MSRGPFVVVLLSALALGLPGLAAASSRGAGGRSPTGYDISSPQCGGPFPTNVLFGIVGVNAGIVYSANPCLGTGDGPSELAWAEQYEPAAILYANTADPGPALSSHWPTGQTTPQYCDGSDSIACSYDYGWNAAADSYRNAVNAYISLGKLAPGATQTPQPNQWWLDVESANSWESNTANNVAALQGEVAYLESQGVSSVGFYATASDWQAITGGTAVFSSYPVGGRGSAAESPRSPTAGQRASPAARSSTASTGRAASMRTCAASSFSIASGTPKGGPRGRAQKAPRLPFAAAVAEISVLVEHHWW